MANKTPQDTLLELWKSIPQDIRPSEPYSVSNLFRCVASLVTQAQQVSQCRHNTELANALGRIQTPNDSWQKLLELTRQHVWQSVQEGFIGDMPAPFDGDVTKYRLWKFRIELWVIMNETAPTDILLAGILNNMTGNAVYWAADQDIRQYSTIDGVPVLAALALERFFTNMDKEFTDYGAAYRTATAFNNARQGSRCISEYNAYFRNIVYEAGFDRASSHTIHRYVDSLRTDLRERMAPWLAEQVEPITLAECMRTATIYDAGR